MLDKQTQTILAVAGQLTAEDLDLLRAVPIGTQALAPDQEQEVDPPGVSTTDESMPVAEDFRPQVDHPGIASRGEYERTRTRASKVSTACLGHEREKHAWWPVGTELAGVIGSERFTALVIENAAVKSGRSLLITSGAASGRLCLTPTRAAIEATEAWRQAHNLGRGGGVTNGWEFWQPVHH